MSTTDVKSAIVIQRYWRNNNSITHLRKIIEYIKTSLSVDDLEEFTNKCVSLNSRCNGDGSGLLGGGLIDMFIEKFFSAKMDKYKTHHVGESDMTMLDMPLSQKKINGKSIIALNWSKNKDDKKYKFNTHIILINLKTSVWWKKQPNNILNNKIAYNNVVKAGIYIIDKNYCNRYIELTSNNKSNTVIAHNSLYCMINRSILQNLYISLPEPTRAYEFNIMNAFSNLLIE
jgi:hypothetical protein